MGISMGGQNPTQNERVAYGLSTKDNNNHYGKYFSPKGWKRQIPDANYKQDGEVSFGVYDLTSIVSNLEYLDSQNKVQITNYDTYDSKYIDGRNILGNVLKKEVTDEQINNGEFSISNEQGEIDESKLVEFMNKLNNWNGFSRLPHSNNYIPCNPIKNGQDTHYNITHDIDFAIFPHQTYSIKDDNNMILKPYKGIVVSKEGYCRVGETRYLITTSN